MDNTPGLGDAMQNAARRDENRTLEARIAQLEKKKDDEASLLDQMAMAAMSGMAANIDFLRGLHTSTPNVPVHELVAISAYEQADAMLKVRGDLDHG